MKPRIPKVFCFLFFIPAAGLFDCASLSPRQYGRFAIEPYDGPAIVREISVGADGFLLTAAGKEECLRLAGADLAKNGFKREFQEDEDTPCDIPSLNLSIFFTERETGGILQRRKSETVEFQWINALTSRPILYMRLDTEDPSGFRSGVFLSRVISAGFIESREWFKGSKRDSAPGNR